ncbi:hypothetical protein ANTQUA_LOCUS10146 [Anthophora quadrimaculata]
MTFLDKNNLPVARASNRRTVPHWSSPTLTLISRPLVSPGTISPILWDRLLFAVIQGVAKIWMKHVQEIYLRRYKLQGRFF